MARVLALALIAAVATTASAAPRKKKTRRRAAKSDQSRFSHVDDATTTPAWKYGELTQEACEAELTKREIGFTRVDEARGVRAPVRLTGRLHGVAFNTDEKPEQRDASVYMIADCRLALAMDDFAQILATHDVVEVRHYSMWRPPAKDWPADKEGTRHAGALALDAGRFTKSDGKVLDVVKDFHGRIGAKTCGDGAGPKPPSPDSLELRAILCETAAAHLFNVMLTPNFNRPHRNHFHLEVTEGVKWFLLH
jgi:hypothetical protein